jgi:hypothetical protein
MIWDFIKDISTFFIQRNKGFFVPIILVLVILGLLLVVGSNSAIAPVLYTLF